jgi:hypothetical protein
MVCRMCFAGPAAASVFRYAYRGESGQRNNLRGAGYFGADMSLGQGVEAD